MVLTSKPNMPDVAKYSRKKTIDHISLFGKANELDVRKMQFRCSKKSSMTGKMDKTTKYNFFLLLLGLVGTSGPMQVHQFCLRFLSSHLKIDSMFPLTTI